MQAEVEEGVIAHRFAGAGWEVPRLLAAMRSASDFFFDSMGQVKLPAWSRGRAVLVGDAGYCPTPLTGLGTSLALVGAYMLAGELVAADGDHRIAFPRNERLMRPYVSRGQQLPPGGVAGYAPTSTLTIRLRALSMRSMNRWPMRRLLSAPFDKAGDIAFPASYRHWTRVQVWLEPESDGHCSTAAPLDSELLSRSTRSPS
ncbi:hypothetical protein NGB36_10320 [Streptomyces sp. RB6PN25]|uniref:FAD-binding domain-containing protein n=1 Tax=Streptomyces humicola TaxID=2953240 RepID=A0ABT1PTI9_9ACTN|nr:hypothetical protein [Streptomyces humicola]MCQ4080982.1 hypothetical protein [Streptomyces humicola]